MIPVGFQIQMSILNLVPAVKNYIKDDEKGVKA